MFGLYRYFLPFCICLWITGCVTIVEKNTKDLNLPKESYAILSIKISNKTKPKYQANAVKVRIIENSKNKPDPENIKKEMQKDMTFYEYDPNWVFFGPCINEVKNEYTEFFIVYRNKPGKHRLEYIRAEHLNLGMFDFGSEGFSYAPIYKTFALPENKVIYLGQIQATHRKKENENEINSCPAIPLFNPFAGGTYDVKVIDNYEKDVKKLLELWPVFKKYPIEKQLINIERPVKNKRPGK